MTRRTPADTPAPDIADALDSATVTPAPLVVEAASPPVAFDAAARLDVSDLPEVRFDPEEQSSAWWCGLHEGAPMWSVVLGGVTFARHGCAVVIDAKGAVENRREVEEHRGRIEWLTPRQVAHVRERVARTVFRVRNPRRDGFSHDTGMRPYEKLDARQPEALPEWPSLEKYERDRLATKRYRPEPNDVPAGYFLFMVPVQPVMPRDWRKSTPPRMCAFSTVRELVAVREAQAVSA